MMLNFIFNLPGIILTNAIWLIFSILSALFIMAVLLFRGVLSLLIILMGFCNGNNKNQTKSKR